MADLAQLLHESCKDGRVCPQPNHWDAIWNLLPDRQQVGGSWQPALPLILGAWWHSSDTDKQDRFALHLRWADEHSALEDVANYLSDMQPGDWHIGNAHG